MWSARRLPGLWDERHRASGEPRLGPALCVLEVELAQDVLDRREHRALENPEIGLNPRVDDTDPVVAETARWAVAVR